MRQWDDAEAASRRKSAYDSLMVASEVAGVENKDPFAEGDAVVGLTADELEGL